MLECYMFFKFLREEVEVLGKKFGVFLLFLILGVPAWLLIAVMVFSGRLKIKGWRFLKLDKGVIVISNHPSLIEPALLPCLLAINVIYGKLPISAPDSLNYYNKFWFAPFRLVCVPIFRGEPRLELLTMDLMRKLVELGHILVLFSEGGRTFKGDYLRKGYLTTKEGERIRRFPRGLRRLFVDLDCYIAFIWCRGMDKISKNTLNFSLTSMLFRYWEKAEIDFGDIIKSANLPKQKKQIIPYLEKKLLKTSTK